MSLPFSLCLFPPGAQQGAVLVAWNVLCPGEDTRCSLFLGCTTCSDADEQNVPVKKAGRALHRWAQSEPGHQAFAVKGMQEVRVSFHLIMCFHGEGLSCAKTQVALYRGSNLNPFFLKLNWRSLHRTQCRQGH